MKQPTFNGRVLLPMSVIEAARAGDPLAVERVLLYGTQADASKNPLVPAGDVCAYAFRGRNGLMPQGCSGGVGLLEAAYPSCLCKRGLKCVETQCVS